MSFYDDIMESDHKVNELLEGFESGRIPLLEFIRSVNRLREESDVIICDPSLGKAVVTCFGRHSEGRDLMAALLTIQGFSVIVVDRDAELKDIVEECMDPKVTVLCMSVQTTYDCPEVLDISEMLKEAGIRERIVLNIGGAAISDKIAEKAECDIYSNSAGRSVRLIKDEVRRRSSARATSFYPFSL